MFYFHSLDGSTVGIRKRLYSDGGHERGRGLYVFGGLCVDKLVMTGTPMVIFVLF